MPISWELLHLADPASWCYHQLSRRFTARSLSTASGLACHRAISWLGELCLQGRGAIIKQSINKLVWPPSRAIDVRPSDIVPQLIEPSSNGENHKYTISYVIMVLLYFVLFVWLFFRSWCITVVYLPIFFRVASGRRSFVPNARETIAKDMGKIDMFQANTKHSTLWAWCANITIYWKCLKYKYIYYIYIIYNTYIYIYIYVLVPGHFISQIPNDCLIH